MSITSDEVNFLVYRYLQESGKKPASCPEQGEEMPSSNGPCAGASNHGRQTRAIEKRELGMLLFRGPKGLGPCCSWGGMRERALVSADISVRLNE